VKGVKNMPAGRPLKFKSVEELEKAIQAYFDDVASKAITLDDGRVIEEPLTITGLALALGTTRVTLMDYEGRDEFSYTIKKAKTVVENYAEKRIFGSNPTGAIFALKNYGWRDKTELDQRYVDKEGEDLHSKDLEIINNYENRIRSNKDD
jgi:hypothetical protein